VAAKSRGGKVWYYRVNDDQALAAAPVVAPRSTRSPYTESSGGLWHSEDTVRRDGRASVRHGGRGTRGAWSTVLGSRQSRRPVRRSSLSSGSLTIASRTGRSRAHPRILHRRPSSEATALAGRSVSCW